MTTMPIRVPIRTAPAAARPAADPRRPEETAREHTPRLRLVRAPARQRAAAPFIGLCVAILAAALLGALFLNISMAETSFAIHDRQVALARLSETRQDLAQEVAAKAAPGSLAEGARALGMVPAPPPAFLRLADSAIIGESLPAAAR